MDYDFALQCLGVELEKVVREHKKVLEKFKEERMSEKEEYFVDVAGDLQEIGKPAHPWTKSNTFDGFEYLDCLTFRVYRKAKPKPYTETITWYPYPEYKDEFYREQEASVLMKFADGSRGESSLASLSIGPSPIAIARMPKGEACQS